MNLPPALWRKQVLRLLCLCRLHRPTDLVLLLLIGLWGSLLASQGSPQWAPMLALLFAATLVRCASWIAIDWCDARLAPDAGESFIAQGLVSRQLALRLFGSTLFIALLLILPLGAPLLYLILAVPPLLVGLALIRSRFFLTQAWLGLCIAWMLPLAHAAQGSWPDKSGWLMFTAAALWATAFTTLYAIPRHDYEARLGVRSLAQLFGEQSASFVLLMQGAAIFTLWLAGQTAPLGLFYTLGLLVAVALLPWQHWLLISSPRRGALRAYHQQIWSGIAIACGILFHFLCLCTPPTA